MHVVTVTALDALLRTRTDIRRGRTPGDALPTRSSGYAPLDAALPGRGWPAGAVTELLVERAGIGELSLLLPLLRELTGDEASDVALVAPPHTPFAPALANAGIVLERLLIIDPPTPNDALWAAERLLRSGRYAAVLLWVSRTTPTRQRRLQLAAGDGGSIGIVYRPIGEADDHSPVALRLVLRVEAGTLRVEPVKVRGGAGRAVELDPQLFDAPQGAPWPVIGGAARVRTAAPIVAPVPAVVALHPA